MEKGAPRTRQSALERITQILDCLYEAGQPMGPYAVAKLIGAPLSTVYVLIEDLVGRDYLARDTDGAVWLGPRLYRYGLAYHGSLDFVRVARAQMESLAGELGEAVQLCGLEGDMMLVQDMVNSDDPFQVASRVGTRVPLNWTASGRLLVGHLPLPQRRALFERAARVSPTGLAETDPDVLARVSGEAFANGISIQMSESDYLVACVAAPLTDLQGVCRATISVVLSAQKVEADSDRYAQAVRAAAGRVRALMGWG